MTARQVYEAMLVELNKTEAPSLLLEDFNYFFNKEINQYINRNYNIYDTNQQTTDDLRVLKSTATLKPVKLGTPGNDNNYYGVNSTNSLYSNVWEVELPEDYMHILNCVCEYELQKRFKCYDKGSLWAQPATRLTSDMWSQIINNFYMRPSYRNPYYFIHNVNPATENIDGELYSKNTSPTNVYSYKGEKDILHNSKGTDPEVIITKEDTSTNPSYTNNVEKLTLSGLSRIVHEVPESDHEDQVEHYPGIRYGNHSPVRMEIRYGKDDSVFLLKKVYVDYLKTPQHIRLTQEQLDKTEDTSQIMEFPDYVCQEIINGLVTLILENSSDQRLQTNLAVNQSIAHPGQQQQTSK